MSIQVFVCSSAHLSVYNSLSSGLLSTALYFMGAPSALSCTSSNVKIEMTCKWKQEMMIIAIYSLSTCKETF